ncbi:MAG: hypothetical protein EOO60_09150 [Hymenobacter sp.]|nr:MAG: hypothetical protein EOO60_09150 [Hymenobacter sp.]
MTEERKRLYRELVRWAMIDMRMYSSWAYSSGLVLLLRRRRSHRQLLRFLNAMNDWLHNVALYSTVDFIGFREDLFWQDYQRFRSRYPADRWAALTEKTIQELRSDAG